MLLELYSSEQVHVCSVCFLKGYYYYLQSVVMFVHKGRPGRTFRDTWPRRHKKHFSITLRLMIICMQVTLLALFWSLVLITRLHGSSAIWICHTCSPEGDDLLTRMSCRIGLMIFANTSCMLFFRFQA